MATMLGRLPWFVTATAVVAAAGVLAFAANYLGADYFERVFLDEASPLASVPTPETSAPDVVPGSDPSPGADAGPPVMPVAMAGVLARGMFRDGEPGHDGEGTALIVRDASGAHFLRFEDFSVTNGPDLYVVLTEEADGGGYENGLNLGRNRATDGNVNYEIPAGTDVSRYRSAIIWCRQFDVVFAVATLEMT